MASSRLTRLADSFRIGQRVELSSEAVAAGTRPGKKSGRAGKVVGHDGKFWIVVHQDGYRKAQTFATWFWQPITKGKR